MQTPEQILGAFRALNAREREAVFLAIAREPTFSAAVRALAREALVAPFAPTE